MTPLHTPITPSTASDRRPIHRLYPAGTQKSPGNPRVLGFLRVGSPANPNTWGGASMNKAELIDAIADRTGIAKSTVDEVIKGMTETIETQVASGDKIAIPGFISFQKVKRAARTGRNPRTGETIKIPASATVKVTAGARLKSSVK